MKDICVAVKFLHDMGVAHRDLKPENLLYSNRGTSHSFLFPSEEKLYHGLCTGSAIFFQPCFQPGCNPEMSKTTCFGVKTKSKNLGICCPIPKPILQTKNNKLQALLKKFQTQTQFSKHPLNNSKPKPNLKLR